MRILVVGAGGVGAAIAAIAERREFFDHMVLADVDLERAERAVSRLTEGGRFSAADSRLCALYFAVFSVSMFLWSAQAIYARAFYAAGNTMAPMLAGTAVTVVSLPIYYALYHLYGATGLAVASNIGIALQTVTIALLLHQRHMVSLASLDYSELGRCLLAAVSSGIAVWITVWAIDALLAHFPGTPLLHHTRLTDLAVLLAGTAIWLAVTKVVLEKSGSALPRVAMKRLGLA